MDGEEKREQTSGLTIPADQGTGANSLLRFLRRWIGSLEHHHGDVPEPSNPAEERNSHSSVLLFLKSLPWLAILLFLYSLVQESSFAFRLPWRSEVVSTRGLLRMLAVSAIIGFGTNWIAVKMLFHPRKRRPLLGQGLIPARRESIVRGLADSITAEIINIDHIKEEIRRSGMITRFRTGAASSLRELLKEEAFRRDVTELAGGYLLRFLRSPSVRAGIAGILSEADFSGMKGLEGKFLWFYTKVRGRSELERKIGEILDGVAGNGEALHDLLLARLEELPAHLERHGSDLDDSAVSLLVFLVGQLDLAGIIFENLNGFDERRLEELLLKTTSDQLQYIQYLGALLGFLGGLFIWLPLESGALFLFLGAVLVGLDALLGRLRARG